MKVTNHCCIQSYFSGACYRHRPKQTLWLTVKSLLLILLTYLLSVPEKKASRLLSWNIRPYGSGEIQRGNVFPERCQYPDSTGWGTICPWRRNCCNRCIENHLCLFTFLQKELETEHNLLNSLLSVFDSIRIVFLSTDVAREYSRCFPTCRLLSFFFILKQ